jgi:hypothetical protein
VGVGSESIVLTITGPYQRFRDFLRSIEQSSRFIEIENVEFFIPQKTVKDKDKKEVIKRGKYRVEIRTATGTKIRTASSQKGLLDVIHGAKNFRVIDDGSNKDITNQIKKFIEARNKQGKSFTLSAVMDTPRRSMTTQGILCP